jgi:hypothetical protein
MTISDLTEKTEPPPPLTQREMNQFITLAALPTLERALERLRWLEAEVVSLKAKADPLAEMWAALESYQEQADRDGHSKSWRNMCELRTVNAALDASGCTRGWSANATMWVGLSLSYRGTNAEKSAQHASEAIDSIRRAKEER